MRKSRVWLGVLLALMLVLISGCQFLDDIKGNQGNEQGGDAASESAVLPLQGEFWIGERESLYREHFESRVPLEALEEAFSLYSRYDSSSQTLSMVHRGKQSKHAIPTNAIFPEGTALGALEGAKEELYVVIGSEVYIAPEVLMVDLGYEVITSSTGRIIRVASDVEEGLIASGKAYTDTGGKADQRLKETPVYRMKGEILVPSRISKISSGPWQLVMDHKANLYWIEEGALAGNVKERPLFSRREGATQPLVMGWDLSGNRSDQVISSTLDVVIPKWLSLKDEAGTINDLYRPQYHQNIVNQGADLWVLVNNSFDPDLTGGMLNNLGARERFVGALVDYCAKNGINGINVDFENMHLKDSDAFVQLLAELQVACLARDITLSVAVTTPGGSETWSLVYDRQRIGEVCDYVTLMAYDQFWASSPVAGPVAGLEWVEKHVANLSEVIEPSKLVLGVPFYTRVWYERPSDQVANTMKVKSRSLFMSGAYKLIADFKPVKVWDEKQGLNYYAYVEDGAVVKFWFEDEAAVGVKAKLATKYGLAGVAAWSLGFETPQTWQVIEAFKLGTLQ